MDSVLSYRKRQESIAQEKLVVAELAVTQALERLNHKKSEIQELTRALGKKQEIGIMAMEIGRYENKIELGRVEIQQLEKIFQEKKDIAIRTRLRLLEKVKDHKALKTLKEQQNKSWRQYLDKKETAMLDEVAILHHDRKIR